MKKMSRLLLWGLVCLLPLGVPALAWASEAEPETIYGSQLMTYGERMNYRQRMRDAATPEEREAIRREHHSLMQERAKTRGVVLPEEMPPAGERGGVRRQEAPGRGLGTDGAPGRGLGPDGQGPPGQRREAPPRGRGPDGQGPPGRY